MKTRTDRHGTRLCESCGVASNTHGASCEPSDILTEWVRAVIAREMAQRTGADVATRLVLEDIREFLAHWEWSIVDGNLNIVEVL
jgi:hypothetical protein